jgi:DNA-binding transcriptional regulator YiaG
MSKLGKAMIEAMEEGKQKGLITLAPSPNVTDLLKMLHLSPQKFAMTYHLNPETVKKWKQGTRAPDSISRAYLTCIAKAPEVIRLLINS